MELLCYAGPMAASYVSVYFENADLYTQLGRQRCIVRNIDDGGVPPVPAPNYFPTDPDTLRGCITAEYVDDMVGERFVRIATVPDLGAYAVLPLNTFESLGAGFGVVIPGDLLTVTIPNSVEWTSEEYPSTTFTFTVISVLSGDQVTISGVFPSFKSSVSWAIPARGLSGILNGVTRREGSPTPGTVFRDYRFNTLWASVPQRDAFVAACEAQLDALGQSSTSAAAVSKRYTSKPLVG